MFIKNQPQHLQMPPAPGTLPPGPTPGYWEGGGNSAKRAHMGMGGGICGSLMRSADSGADLGVVGIADVT